MINSLTPKQHRFIEEYLIDLNATQAAIRAGYGTKNADKIGPELLGKTRVAEAIEEAKAERSVRTQISQDQVVYELSLVSMSDIDHYDISDDGQVDLKEGAPRHAKRAIASLKKKVTTRTKGEHVETTREVELRFWNKTEGLGLLARHLGMLVDRVEHTGKDGGDIKIDGPTEEERLARLVGLAQQAQQD